MGSFYAKPNNSIPNVNSDWKYSFATGYKFVSPNVNSGYNIIKRPGILGSEIWGPYQKQYTAQMFNQHEFTPPDKVDGVPILCKCSEIRNYEYGQNGPNLGASFALLFGSNRPACWEFSDNVLNPFESPQDTNTFYVIIGHPDFYRYKITGGKRKSKTKRSKRKK